VTCHVPKSTTVYQPGITTIFNSACKSRDKEILFLNFICNLIKLRFLCILLWWMLINIGCWCMLLSLPFLLRTLRSIVTKCMTIEALDFWKIRLLLFLNWGLSSTCIFLSKFYFSFSFSCMSCKSLSSFILWSLQLILGQ
jgi:hypothetical protein